MNFTPGPWTYHPGEETIIARTRTVVYELNTNESDGNLIAAAPDLYAALQAITDQLERVGDDRKDAPFIEAARTALAKAEGKQP